MLLQALLTLTVFVGLKSGLTPNLIWVVPALMVIWWRPAFKYGSAALAIGGILILPFAEVIDPDSDLSTLLTIMVPVTAVAAPFAFAHDAALAKQSTNAYKLSALGWFGWFSGGLVASFIFWRFLNEPWAAPSHAQFHQGSVCTVATPICLYYFIKALWTKKPQATYSMKFA